MLDGVAPRAVLSTSMGWRITVEAPIDGGWLVGGEGWRGDETGAREPWSYRYTHSEGPRFEYGRNPNGTSRGSEASPMWSPPAEPLSRDEFVKRMSREVAMHYGAS
jgi:hypothetical protein